MEYGEKNPCVKIPYLHITAYIFDSIPRIMKHRFVNGFHRFLGEKTTYCPSTLLTFGSGGGFFAHASVLVWQKVEVSSALCFSL